MRWCAAAVSEAEDAADPDRHPLSLPLPPLDWNAFGQGTETAGVYGGGDLLENLVSSESPGEGFCILTYLFRQSMEVLLDDLHGFWSILLREMSDDALEKRFYISFYLGQRNQPGIVQGQSWSRSWGCHDGGKVDKRDFFQQQRQFMESF